MGNHKASLQIRAKKALNQLLTLVCRESGHLQTDQLAIGGQLTSGHRRTCEKLGSSFADDAQNRLPNLESLHILIYFDEAHTLGTPLRNGKVALDTLIDTLGEFSGSGLFTLFVSTQSRVQYFSTYTHSSRYRNLVESDHAPITETPFDCFGSKALDPSLLHAHNLCEVGLMACFGRPL